MSGTCVPRSRGHRRGEAAFADEHSTSQSSSSQLPLTALVAGGGTAGHIEPALAVADALVHQAPGSTVIALGTTKGLETAIVPQRGYRLELIPPVPFPRKISKEILRFPLRVVRSVLAARKVLRKNRVQVVVGFGGYVALPAYIAAATLKIPIVVHEANARAGLANKVGAKLARVVLAAVPGSGLNASVVGMPVRQSISNLDRSALRAEARRAFGLDADAPTLLVTGGSQGAQSLNRAVIAAAVDLGRAGVGVLHAYGPKNSVQVAQTPGAPAYVAVPYIDRMDLAIAASDFAISRAGAMTVAETAATGLPAVYVPLPHGNGEQALNAQPVVHAGGGMLVDDAELTANWIRQTLIPIVTDAVRVAEMSRAAKAMGHSSAATDIARIAIEVARR